MFWTGYKFNKKLTKLGNKLRLIDTVSWVFLSFYYIVLSL